FEEEVIRCTRHDLPAGLQVTVKRNRSQYEVELVAEPARPMLLHWAINDWQQPPEGLWPANTRREGSQACQTPFAADGRLRLVLPEAQCPPSLVFVLKETQPEAWINDGGTDFRVQLKPPGLANLVDKVVEAESTYTHWSLFNRFCMAI
ncbi:carbohydrate-Binding Module Family 45, partial [Haematococcus lacustris]